MAREILSLPSFEHYDMVRLDCEDLKRGLAEAAKGLADLLLNRVAQDHRKENERFVILTVTSPKYCTLFKYHLEFF